MQPHWEHEYIEFVTTAMPRLRRLAYLLCGDAHRADDLVQQTFTTLYVHWPRVRNVGHLDGYVRATLVRFFQGEKRRPWSKRVRLTDSPPEPLPRYGPDVEERTVLRAALDRLPRKQRAVLVLRFLCDMSVTEVAETLGCAPGTVKSQSFHGLATLRRLLAEQPGSTTPTAPSPAPSAAPSPAPAAAGAAGEPSGPTVRAGPSAPTARSRPRSESPPRPATSTGVARAGADPFPRPTDRS
ncbi:SigE family RNA polymerase sigma factor [Plantactinospora sp. WMMB782]|uniref:SigE family RNA polymerase sigma factor n=1 Tax=Plantactinospora sp. WMMB782 TaxID=3404121 RepID=UPI003B92C7B5